VLDTKVLEKFGSYTEGWAAALVARSRYRSKLMVKQKPVAGQHHINDELAQH
jgi:hypothetical protein